MQQKPESPSARPAARFDFNKAAENALHQHPELKNKTLFIDIDTGERSGSLVARARGFLSRKFNKAIDKAAARYDGKKLGGGTAIRNTAGLNAVLLTGNRPFGFVANPVENAAMDSHFAFNHEVGHLVVPAAMPRKIDEYFEKLFDRPYSREEGAADAYAVIRHAQDFGAASHPIEYAAIRRALGFINSETLEYNNIFIIDAVLRDRERLVNAKLTPGNTVIAAGLYADRYTPGRAVTEQMRKDFAPLKGVINKTTREDLSAFKKLATIALDPQTSPYSFYLANRVIGRFLGKSLSGPEWVDIAKKLHEKEKSVTLDALFPPVAKRDPKAAPKKAA